MLHVASSQSLISSRATRAAGLMGNGHPVSANSDIVFGYQILLSEVLLYCLPKIFCSAPPLGCGSVHVLGGSFARFCVSENARVPLRYSGQPLHRKIIASRSPNTPWFCLSNWSFPNILCSGCLMQCTNSSVMGNGTPV